MRTTFEQFLNTYGLNRTNITELIDSSPPTTRLLMQNPLDLKVSQVMKLAEKTDSTFQELAGLITETHEFKVREGILTISKLESTKVTE